jgi:hypothetical protein
MQNELMQKSAQDLFKLLEVDPQARAVYKNTNWLQIAKHVTNKDGTLTLREKIDQLRIFLHYFSDLPPQGSAAWKSQRQAIGGSEIQKIIMGTPSDKKGIFTSKLGVTNFRGSIHTRWGNLFESMAQLYCDTILETETFETGSIPGLRDEDGNVIQSYSPDGLNILHVEKFARFVRPQADTQEIRDKYTSGYVNRDHIINLMEFKCPPSTLPKGSVPEQYYAQPRVGACTIDIVDTCLFVNSAFRRCSYDDFVDMTAHYSNNYFNGDELHKYDSSANFSSDEFPFVHGYPMGFIGVYNTKLPYAGNNTGDAENAENVNTEFWDYDEDEINKQLEEHHTSSNITNDQSSKQEDISAPESIDDILRKNPKSYEPIAEYVDAHSGAQNKPDRVIALITCAWEFMEANQYYVSASVVDDIWEVLKLLVPKFRDVSIVQINTYRSIIKDTITNFINTAAGDNLLNCRADFGREQSNNLFANTLQHAIDERFAISGHKIYYCKKIIHAVAPNKESPHANRNYINKQIWKFLRECKIRNACPVGIIP